jgi:hypothetical protein
MVKLATPQWMVKHTFVHCAIDNAEATPIPGAKWKARTDISAARDRGALEYVRCFLSGQSRCGTRNLSPQLRATEKVESSEDDRVNASSNDRRDTKSQVLDYLRSFLAGESRHITRNLSCKLESAEPAELSAENMSSESSEEGSSVDRVAYSLGAAGHYEGTCKPCAWNWKPAGCSKGSDCDFCHLCGEDALRQQRRQKVARLREEDKRGKRAQRKIPRE